jgi:exodeoxyribonuclease VII large subunit
MFMENVPRIGVTEFVEAMSSTLELSYPSIAVEGEVGSFKVNQGKFVFFDLKDEGASFGCFMMLFNLRMALEDGMRVVVVGTPKITTWGKFSFTVAKIMPVGEGSIKRNFELLRGKLEKEGLFAPERKRGLPEQVAKIGVISSTDAAGYKDFVKILGERWGGLELYVAHCQVQGVGAVEQVVRALKYFNERGEVDVVAILRGGGSADDLAAFNDEGLAREIAASKIVVVTGIGHEVDVSLADLAADVRASTPSNAAQMLTRDRREVVGGLRREMAGVERWIKEGIAAKGEELNKKVVQAGESIVVNITTASTVVVGKKRELEGLSPENVLRRGYGILRGEYKVGSVVEITTMKKLINAEVKSVKERVN